MVKTSLKRASTIEQCVSDAAHFLGNPAYWKTSDTIPRNWGATKKSKKVVKKPTPAIAKTSKKVVTKPTKKAATKKNAKPKKVEKPKKKVSAPAVVVAKSPAVVAPKSPAVPSPAYAKDKQAKKQELIQSFMPATGTVSGVDVVFSFDATGSMNSCLKIVKKNLADMVKQLLTDLPTIRIGLLCHGDYDADFLTKRIDFTNNVDDLVNFINSVTNARGGDIPEAYEFALHECWKEMSWNDANTKALVVIGDSSPHTPDFPANKLKLDWKEEVRTIAAKDIKIYSVHVPRFGEAEPFFQAMATMTSGSYLLLDDMPLLQDMFMGVCYREGYEMEIATNASRYEGILEDLEKEIEALGVEGGAARLLRPDDGAEAIAISNEDMLEIHESIHDINKGQVSIHGKTYPIAWGSAGNRYVRIHALGLLFIQQNIERSNKYAQMAREGKKITWMCKEGKWGVIINNTIDKKLE